MSQQNSNHSTIACLSVDKTIIPFQAPLNQGQLIVTSLSASLVILMTLIIWKKYRYFKWCSQVEKLERLWNLNYKSDCR